MKRLNLLGSWKRIGIQAGLLAGLGLAFMGPNAEKPATAADNNECPEEDQCTFKKPVFSLILDYSTSMNNSFGDPMDNITRWEAEKGVIQNLMTADNEFVSQNMLVGLMRFGHDPDPNNPGTTIPNDASGITDGQSVDVLWFDENNNNEYKPCNGQEVIDTLNGVPAPINGNLVGIGTWTRGAIQRSLDLMEQSIADHPNDVPSIDNRAYLQMVMTDGEWTNPTGQGQSPANDPSPLAADMITNGIGQPGDETLVPTYVVYFGDLGGNGEAEADKLADSGDNGMVDMSTGAITADDQQQLIDAVNQVVTDIKNSVILPNCIGGLPRLMVLMDASSSMLNSMGQPAAYGESGWDQARYALAGDPLDQNQSLFEQDILDDNMMPTGNTVEDLVYLGLAVFGHNAPAPGEQKVLVQYGPCHQDNFYWAMSPEISDPSCPDYDYSELANNPGLPMNQIITDMSCASPWEGSPINWSFPEIVMGAPGPNDDPDGPGFDEDTFAHMPRCDSAGGPDPFCSGSGTYTHLGLQLVKNNQAAYHAQAVMNDEADDSTVYTNLLITDGQYNGYSTDAQVQAELEEMANNGILTYVIGLGDGVNGPQAQAQLNNMAGWGGTNAAYDANNQAELELALKTIIEAVDFDPCCQFNDCSENPEPTTGEVDPDPTGCEDDDDCEDPLICIKPDPMAPFGQCGEDPDPCEGVECAPGDDNTAPEVCLDGQCVPGPCLQDSHCDGDALPPEVCDVDNGICSPGPCADDSQCPEGSVCTDGECVIEGCMTDDDCDGDLVCDVDSGICIEPPNTCTSDDDCGVDEICNPDTMMCEPDPNATGTDTDGATTGGATDGDSDPSAGPTTGNGSDGSATAGETDTDTGSTDSGADSAQDDEGCGCTTQDSTEGKGRGLLGTVLALGFAGFIRRRRRRD